ncbi:uncharacterized protein [Nicotiana tomentosiformis]|uniref:uncharacterized protein n=1 Tax=Nicotiana tomentosiformis TaxID=4098 RepID=UPI00051B06CE|nr:uncharacterized protein LOC104113674 [Nicotiana tomentosiformis]
MDNTIPTSPTNQWMDIGMPYYQQTDFGIANPYDQRFSDSTIITTGTTQNTIDQHQYSSTLSPENSSQIAGNDDIHELSPKTSKGKPIRRRSRASKKTPTTLVNTSITNFRAAVQQYTGCDHTSPIFKNQKGPINLSFGPSTDDVQTEFFGSNLVGEGSRNYGYYSNYEDQTERSKDKLQQDQESGNSPSAAYSNSGNSKLSVDDYGIW